MSICCKVTMFEIKLEIPRARRDAIVLGRGSVGIMCVCVWMNVNACLDACLVLFLPSLRLLNTVLDLARLRYLTDAIIVSVFDHFTLTSVCPSIILGLSQHGLYNTLFSSKQDASNTTTFAKQSLLQTSQPRCPPPKLIATPRFHLFKADHANETRRREQDQSRAMNTSKHTTASALKHHCYQSFPSSTPSPKGHQSLLQQHWTHLLKLQKEKVQSPYTLQT